MPLIDTVIDLVVRQSIDKHLIVAEHDGTEYRFDPGRNEFIENETLSVRVTGMDKNLELGRKDELLGVVLDCKLSLESITPFPAEMIETGEWKPEWLYGPTAARDFFPDHCHRSWRLLAPNFKEAVSEDNAKILDEASRLLQSGHHGDAMELISEMLGKIPWLLDLYHVMGTLAYSNKQLIKAEKYFTMGILFSESIIPDSDDFILDYRDSRNHFYLSHLHSLGDLMMKTGKPDEALDIFSKMYRLMPQDPGGVRVLLQELTGKEYPQTSENVKNHPVNPFLAFEDYPDFPLHDSYDPNTKPDYSKWLGWEEAYRHLLIFNAHKDWFAANKFSYKDMYTHTVMHDVVESALAQNEPPELRLQVARNMAAGQTRHDLIHEIGHRFLQHFAEKNKQNNTAQSR
jgi:tetratricopeptide (TPR) repeat protein